MKILFLEEREYYKNLGLKISDEITVEYNGIKYYKKNDALKRYDYIISFMYLNPMCNYIITKANELGIETILVSDGIVDWTYLFNWKFAKKKKLVTFHPIIHDYFFVLGKFELGYFQFKGDKAFQYLPKRIIKEEKIKLPKEIIFLITTANTSYFDLDEKKVLINLMNQTIDVLEELNIKFKFRIFDKELIKHLKNYESYENVIECNFLESISDITHVITTPSSISLESMFNERKVCHFFYRDDPVFLRSAWNLIPGLDIKKSLKDFYYGNKEKNIYQKYILSTYLESNEIIEKLPKTTLNSQMKNKSIESILDSPLNFNFENFIRKIYLKLKLRKIKNQIVKKIIIKSKNKD
ncbi:hypothetical protein NRK67_16420 [Fusobacteria bacterium ZRK30]|nr:hypothetical protein NRK67_16420 [Fusobacteria bacterium ZRK30]